MLKGVLQQAVVELFGVLIKLVVEGIQRRFAIKISLVCVGGHAQLAQVLVGGHGLGTEQQAPGLFEQRQCLRRAQFKQARASDVEVLPRGVAEVLVEAAVVDIAL